MLNELKFYTLNYPLIKPCDLYGEKITTESVFYNFFHITKENNTNQINFCTFCTNCFSAALDKPNKCRKCQRPVSFILKIFQKNHLKEFKNFGCGVAA